MLKEKTSKIEQQFMDLKTNYDEEEKIGQNDILLLNIEIQNL